MGCRYSGDNPSITPSTTTDNWTLQGVASTSGKILEVHFGGEVTTSTAMHTRVCRDSALGTTSSAGNVEKLHPYSPSVRFTFSTGWATQPTLSSPDLFAESWNAHGGVVRWLASPGEEFVIVGAAGISCRNTVGVATSSYGVIWEED